MPSSRDQPFNLRKRQSCGEILHFISRVNRKIGHSWGSADNSFPANLRFSSAEFFKVNPVACKFKLRGKEHGVFLLRGKTWVVNFQRSNFMFIHFIRRLLNRLMNEYLSKNLLKMS